MRLFHCKLETIFLAPVVGHGQFFRHCGRLRTVYVARTDTSNGTTLQNERQMHEFTDTICGILHDQLIKSHKYIPS
jgi:hypothetical protein